MYLIDLQRNTIQILITKKNQKKMSYTLKQIFIGKTEDTKIQLIRNIIVEATRIGINSLILWLLYIVIFKSVANNTILSICTIIASMTSGIVNYIFSTIWVFHKKQKNNNIARFIVFTLIGAAGLGINTGITVGLTNWLGMNVLVSNLIAQGIAFIFNFFMRKYFVYTLMSKTEDEQPKA